MVYFYHFGYYPEKDEFFAMIDDGQKYSKVVFSIDYTREVCDYIMAGRMKHIDDFKGLEDLIKEMDFIRPEDTLEMGDLYS